MLVNWKSVGAFAAVFAAILTIAFNAFVQWRQLKQAKRSALKRTLYSLVEIFNALKTVKVARDIHKGNHGENILSIAHHIQPIVGKVPHIEERLMQSISSLAMEAPILASEIAQIGNRLNVLRNYSAIGFKAPDTKIMMVNEEVDPEEHLNDIYALICHSIIEVADAILVIAHVCDRSTQSNAKKFVQLELDSLFEENGGLE